MLASPADIDTVTLAAGSMLRTAVSIVVTAWRSIMPTTEKVVDVGLFTA